MGDAATRARATMRKRVTANTNPNRETVKVYAEEIKIWVDHTFMQRDKIGPKIEALNTLVDPFKFNLDKGQLWVALDGKKQLVYAPGCSTAMHATFTVYNRKGTKLQEALKFHPYLKISVTRVYEIRPSPTAIQRAGKKVKSGLTVRSKLTAGFADLSGN